MTEPRSFINLRNARCFPRAADIPRHGDRANDFFIPADECIETSIHNRKVPHPPKSRKRHWCTIAAHNAGTWTANMRPGEHDWPITEYESELSAAHIVSSALYNDVANGGRDIIRRMPINRDQGCVALMYTVDIGKKDNALMLPGVNSNLLPPDAASVKIFKCTLDELMRINDDFHSKVAANELELCCQCQKPSETRCTRCKSSYCSPECQKAHWSEHSQNVRSLRRSEAGRPSIGRRTPSHTCSRRFVPSLQPTEHENADQLSSSTRGLCSGIGVVLSIAGCTVLPRVRSHGKVHHFGFAPLNISEQH